MAATSLSKPKPINLSRMMERLGIEPAGGVVTRWSLSYATALHRCRICACKQACHAWLDRKPQAVSFAPSFCPIADILFEMQVDQPPDAAPAHHH